MPTKIVCGFYRNHSIFSISVRTLWYQKHSEWNQMNLRRETVEQT